MVIMVLSSCCLISALCEGPMPVQTHESAEESLKKDGIVIIEHPEDDPTGSTRLLNVPPGKYEGMRNCGGLWRIVEDWREGGYF